MSRGNFYRRPASDSQPPADSPEGRDIGANDHLVPGGQPHIRNRPVKRQAVPAPPPRPEYGGVMAHGVWTEAADRAQAQDPGSETARERLTIAAPSMRGMQHVIPPPPAPIPVIITEVPGGTQRLNTGAFLRYQVPALGSPPVRIAGRDPARTMLAVLNEDSEYAMRLALFPGDLAADAGGTTGLAVGGALLPAAMGSYLRLRTQSEVFATTTDSSNTAYLSVIIEYEIEAGPR